MGSNTEKKSWTYKYWSKEVKSEKSPIFSPTVTSLFSRFRVEYVDIHYYFQEYRQEIDSMKPFLCSKLTRTISYVSLF